MKRFLLALAVCLLLWLAFGAIRAAAEDAPPDEQTQSEVETAEAGQQADASTADLDGGWAATSDQGGETDEEHDDSGQPAEEDRCDNCDRGAPGDEALTEEEEEEGPDQEEEAVTVQPAPAPIPPVTPLTVADIGACPVQAAPGVPPLQLGGVPGGDLGSLPPVVPPAPVPPPVIVIRLEPVSPDKVEEPLEAQAIDEAAIEEEATDEEDEDINEDEDQIDQEQACADCRNGGDEDAILDEDQARGSGRRQHTWRRARRAPPASLRCPPGGSLAACAEPEAVEGRRAAVPRPPARL